MSTTFQATTNTIEYAIAGSEGFGHYDRTIKTYLTRKGMDIAAQAKADWELGRINRETLRRRCAAAVNAGY